MSGEADKLVLDSARNDLGSQALTLFALGSSRYPGTSGLQRNRHVFCFAGSLSVLIFLGLKR